MCSSHSYFCVLYIKTNMYLTTYSLFTNVLYNYKLFYFNLRNKCHVYIIYNTFLV